MSGHNLQRLSEDVKRELSSAIQHSKDARIAGELYSVTRCEITSDLSFCKVYISSLKGGEDTDKAVDILSKAEGYFKSELARRVKMRKVPQLTFVADKSLDYYQHINEILNSLPKPKEHDGQDE